LLLRKRNLEAPAEQRSPATHPPDPRQEFLSVWAHLGRQRQQLLLISVLALGIAATVLIAYVRLANASRLVPYLYVVDRGGELLALGTAQPTPADSDPIVYNALDTFISGIRSVYTDQNAERYVLQRSYAYLPNTPGSTAASFLGSYLAQNDPRKLAEVFTRSVEIVSILRVPNPSGSSGPSSWRVKWREITTPLAGGAATLAEWEAFLTVRIKRKKTIDAFDQNPIGIWIDHLTWSLLSQRPVTQQP